MTKINEVTSRRLISEETPGSKVHHQMSANQPVGGLGKGDGHGWQLPEGY